MNENKRYTTDEQQDILNKLNQLNKRDYADTLEFNVHSTIADLKEAGTLKELDEKAKNAAEDGVAYTLRTYENNEFTISWLSEDIEKLEKELSQKKTKLEKVKRTQELLEQLESTGFQNILNTLKEERRQEIENIEYDFIYKVYKTTKYWGRNYWDKDHKVVVKVEKWRVEIGNHNNREKWWTMIELDWKDRGRLAEEMKEREITTIVVDPKVLTKKLEKEFNVIGKCSSSYDLF